MNSIFTYVIYIITAISLFLSYSKNKHKTTTVIKRAWKMFLNLLPQFIAVLLFLGLLLAVVTPNMIQNVIGSESGIKGMMIASFVGSVALVPVLVAFPIASQLLQNGAGLMQITLFICTLTTVGIVTLPLERKFLGNKLAILRNVLFYIFSFLVAYLMEVLL